MKPENAPHWMGGTMIAKALLACKKTLAGREEGDRMIILVTDGFSFDLANGNDEAVARELKAENIAVYAIHVADTEVPAADRHHHEPDRRRGVPLDRPGIARGRSSSGSTP